MTIKKDICFEYLRRPNGWQVIAHYKGKTFESGIIEQLPFSPDELTSPSQILEKEKSTYDFT